MEYIIETKNLSRKFGNRKSVDSIDLQVPRQGVYGFLGPNGAGKTTTLRMILQLIRPTEGKITVFGLDAKKHRTAILHRIGSLIESPSYYGHLSAYENCKVFATVLDVSNARIQEVLRLVRLDRDAHRKVKEFSLGMKQRLGIAIAMLHQPELIILDEPTNGLDPAGIQEIRELICRLPQEIGATILVSSHLLSEVEQIATHLGIIRKGKLIYQDTLVSLKKKSQPRLELDLDDFTRTQECIQSLGYASFVEDGKVIVPGVGREQSPQIMQSLFAKKVMLYQVYEHRKSLEQIFLEMTQEEDA